MATLTEKTMSDIATEAAKLILSRLAEHIEPDYEDLGIILSSAVSTVIITDIKDRVLRATFAKDVGDEILKGVCAFNRAHPDPSHISARKAKP